MAYRDVLQAISDRMKDPIDAALMLALANELDKSFEMVHLAIRDTNTAANLQYAQLLAKFHTLNNFVMSIEGKIDEIHQFILIQQNDKPKSTAD